jgi:DNA-binding transcriptional ArsR family regulator
VLSTPAADPTTLEERVAARLTRQRQQVTAVEKREPLRRRILEALGEAPASPRELAPRLQAAPESISRQLRVLREAQLVAARETFGDGRVREYELTSGGVTELRRHRTFGARKPPPPELTTEQSLGFLQSALENAVKMRRRTNRLDDAEDRLRAVLRQAEKAHADELAVETIAELATTLRQSRQPSAVSELLERLQLIALGQHPTSTATLALPAAAHRAYALGRRGARSTSSAQPRSTGNWRTRPTARPPWRGGSDRLGASSAWPTTCVSDRCSRMRWSRPATP